MKLIKTSLSLFVLVAVTLVAQGADSSDRAQGDQTSKNVKPLALPNTPAGVILKSWLTAHNSGEKEALADWLRMSFPENKFTQDSFASHVDFYVQSMEMFGVLIPEPYKIIKSTENDLVVYFIEKGYEDNAEIDPFHVVTVEINVDPENQKFLKRGLGLGNLVCAIKEDRKDLLGEDDSH